ncbi:type II secretion system F family protein [Candidatus Woesearchaeota archaeon]|nr:type II secretion system F family protein [Candidatus Woesearchaeota archaeon]
MKDEDLLEQILMAEEWGIMLSSGVELSKSLQLLKERYPNYDSEIGTILNSVESGWSIKDELHSVRAERFYPFLAAMIEVGEETYNLCNALIGASETLWIQLRVKRDKPTKYNNEVVFYTQLAALVERFPVSRRLKQPAERALEVIRCSDYLPEDWKEAIMDREGISYDNLLSGVMSKHKEIFDEMDAEIVKSAEKNRTLKDALNNLAQFYCKRREYELCYKK